MSGNGRLITPNQINVATTYADGPLAQPSSVAMQGPGGMQILVCGGLTKVEALAGQIAGGWIAHTNLLHVAMRVNGGEENFNQSEVEDRIATIAVNMAEKILAETARRRAEAAKEAP